MKDKYTLLMINNSRFIIKYLNIRFCKYYIFI